jgi:rubrerythrin
LKGGKWLWIRRLGEQIFGEFVILLIIPEPTKTTMDTKSTTDILKEAILLEHRGRAFYSDVAARTDSEAVKRIFTMIAEEEGEHIRFLSEQFKNYQKHKTFLDVTSQTGNAPDEVSLKVLTEEMKSQISAAGFEAAAISAAMDFEAKAVDLYSSRAAAAADQNEKALYSMLADWERGHHKWLMRIDKELREQVWYDNNFWPF